MKSEYCIMHYAYPGEPHRVPPVVDDEGEPVDALEWCQNWLNEWRMDAPSARPGIFYVASRPVGEWTPC